MGRKVGLVYDERMCAHADPWDPAHPETPLRILSIAKRLRSAGLFQRCVRVPAREATDDELATVHTEEHVKLMRNVSSSKAFGRTETAGKFNSIYFNEGSSESALLAAGSVIELSMQVACGELEAGVAIVRPPGHHAEADAAMGFCLFNNVAVAAHILLDEKKELGISRVLIVDWDVHHGNGTQHMFWDNPQVLYFSVHRYDGGTFYPPGNEGYLDKVGAGNGAGFNVNVPWPHGGYGDADYLAVWDYVLLPLAQQFKPDIILISAGFDSAKGDPLGGCELTPYGFAEMTRKLVDLADGRVVLVLEGGYNLRSIAESYLACLQILLGDPPTNAPLVSKPFASTWSLINEVQEVLQEFWPVLATLNSCVRKEMQQVDISLDAKLANVTFSDGASSSSEGSLDTTDQHALSASGDADSDIRHDKELGKVFADLSLERANARLDGPAIENSTMDGKPLMISDTAEVQELSPRAIEEQVPYVWYASYASNMWKPRFMCYLQGGQVEGMRGTCLGTRNKDPPCASAWMQLGNQLFFGHSYTSFWGEGGVGFLEHKPTDSIFTHIRLYKIRVDQLNDLFMQENLLSVFESELITNEVCRNLLPQSSIMLKDTWYGTVLCLGEKDGLPILTLTCSETDIDKFKAGLLPRCPPADAYARTIARGLMEELGLSDVACAVYMASKFEINK